MKNLITYLKTLWSRVADSQRNDRRHDCRLTVGSPSGFNSKLMLKLVSVLVLILTVGSGNVWGAKDDVVYKINTASTKIATSTTYANYGPSTCASAQAGSTVSSASWCVTCGSAQTEGLWLGANNNQKAKMKLGNGSFTEASGIASAIGVTTSATYYAAMICRTNLSKVYKVTLTYATPGGTAPSEAWILYSTDNGSTWSVGKKVTSLSTSGTDFVFDATITSAARYAFVIHSTGYCQFKKPVLTFYEGTTGGTTYTVTYNLNGGTGTTPTESAKSSGETFSLHNGTTNITPPSGKVFSQWKDQDNNYYDGGDTYTMPAKNVTLTAQWVNTYTVTYNLNGGTGTTPTEGAHPSGATFTLHDGTTGITAPTKKVFSKWRDQDGTDYEGGDTYTMPSKNVTLTAQWVAAGGDYVLVEDAEDIGPGKYLIVYNNAKALKTHYGNVNANTYATYTDISSYYNNKKIASNATTDALAYTVAETTNGYSISHKESGTTYYLGNSSNSTGAYLRWDNPFTTSQDEWTLGVNSIVSARNSNYAIRWNNNSGSYRFAIYNPTGQQAVQLFKQVEACEEAELAYSPATETKTYGDAAFTKTLTNSHSVAVTYALSDVSPAGCVSINTSTGQVTINGAGSATVTASSAKQTVSDVDYCADEASYTLTVNKASISPTLTYTPNSVAVGESTAAPSVGGNSGSGGVTYAITSASPSGCATINTSTGVVTGVATGSVTITATIAATTNYNGNTATATVTITAASNFPNNRTIFIQAHSTSAWTGGGCVKAWFHSYGGSETAQSTYWLFDAGSPDEGKKLFAAIVPSTGNLPYLDIQRFAANCSDWWNKNGGCSYSDADGSNAIRSTGKHDDSSEGDYVRWNDDAVTLSLYGDPNSWGSSLASFSDQGNGVWTATYNNYAPANAAGESQEFKICTNYNGWIGNTGSNNNVTVDGMHVGSTYNIGASLDIKTHTLTLTKTFVKGTVHFNLQGHGSDISDLTNVAAGSKISAPSTPSATGYDFGGWYKEPACTNQWNFGSDVVNETMTLYAKWTKHSYTISSTLNHCTASPSIPSSYEYTGSAAGLTYTISADAGYRLPTSITVTGTTYTWNSATGALTLTGTITSNVSITITAVQTHTVTWLSNGSNFVSPVTYDHGAALAFPASEPTAPSSCSEKVFVGWTSDSEITSETSTEPTLISEGGAVNEDATYRAVFADEEGGGTKWVRVEVNSSPFTLADVSEGQYALVDASGYAFNGTISSGHGQSTETAATFVGNEAASMPDGYCELTFTKVTDVGGNIIGYTMYSADQEKYLFAQAASTGNLAWHASETSYWKYYGSNWQYNSNSANLRVYNHTFRTYNNSSNQSLWLAKKTGGISYDNYITQCCALKPVTNLAVSSSTANSVTLTWTAPSPTTGIDHLELRNASTDVKIGSNIAVATTTTSVSGLAECNTYSYKIVSVGASCETSSDAIEAQPFSGAKTVTFNYNGGSGSPASFTTSCAGNTVALPTPDTRTGYTFQGWWSAQNGGTKKGDAGDIYTVSGNTTIWAHWSETNYTVTMAQDPAVGATLTGGTTTAHYGGTINISTTVPSGYRFTGWTASPSVTFADASATSTSFTMPNSDVTVTAHFVQVHTLTFDVPTGGGSAVTPPATADHGGTVTLPNVTGIAAEYSCETFLGWTTTAPNAEGGTKWSSTPTIKAAGATSDVINSNTTFYAVYSRSGGGASGTVELTCTDVNNWWTVTLNSTKNSYGTVTHHTATDGSTWYTDGQIQGAACVDLKAADNRYIQIPTTPGTISSIEMQVSQSTASNTAACGTGTATSHIVAFRTTASGSNVFTGTSSDHSCTINISSGDYYTGYIVNTDGTTNIHSVTVNYGPAPVISHNVACPDCEISQFTLSYNANTSYFPGSTTTCTGVTDYLWAEHDDIYTICSTEPTLTGYKFTGWATNANGSGTVYTAGQEISCVPETPLTLYAQYERVYTIHFNDQSTVTDRTQASSGAAVTVPAHTTPCVMLGATWEFAGWSKTGGSLNDAASATIDIAANATEYTPAAIDEGQTFYAVYKKTLSGGGAFSVGKSGVYKFYYHSGSSDYWAAGKQNTYGIYSTTTAGDAHSFRFTYFPTGTYAGKYTIQNDAGEYIGYSGSSTPLAYNASAADNHYYWTITASGGGFIVQNVQTATRYLASNGSNFNGKTSSEVLSFVAADVVSYYTIMTCASSFSLTFEDGGGTINWEVGHAEGTYQDVADGTVFTVFPTATMDGWTFIGWTAGQGYSDMSKYSEGRDATTGSGVIVPEDADLYSTGGNSYTIHSNITMYPVFTRFEDNEPIDLTNGGDYYIYFLESGSDDGYGAEKRVYAAEYSSDKRYNSTAVCSAATTFTFTKLDNGNWTIYDNTTNKYLYGIEDDDLKQQASATGAEWTLTVNGNQFDAFHVGTSYGQLIAQGNGTSATFMNYRRTNTAQAGYNRVYLGSCTNRVFSSNPSTIPEIDLKGTATITASQNGAVRATNVLTVSGHNLTPSTGEISITSDNSDVYFSTSTTASFAAGIAAASNPQSSITVMANSSGIVEPTAVYVHYKPSSNTDEVNDITVTATYTGATDATSTIKVRSVKENFVIAAKVGSNWYALPADMSTSDVHEPTLIEVDETAKEAFGPSTIAYKMWPVKTTNGSGNRYETYGDEVRFAGNDAKALWANNVATGTTTGIRNWAVVNSLTSGGSGSGEDADERYEWKLSTTDGEIYTIQTNQSNNKRELVLYRPSSGAHAGKLVWATNGTNETNEIHFFPLTEREVITIIPREWKANGLVFSVAADNQITAVSYKIGTGSETSTTYTRHSTGGYGLYEVALPDLTNQYGKLLTLKLTISGTPTYATTTIPIIVNANASTKDSEPFVTLGAATKDYDVVVLDGKTLTTDAIASGACKFQNLYIYPGATLVNAVNNNLSVRYLELRGGIKGIDHKSDLEQGVPHLKLDKNFTSTAGANLDMYVNTAHSYALSVPFNVTLSTVNFANSLNTTTSEPINGALDAQFMIMEYDGAQRASTGKGWKHITSTERVLHAGEGYVLQGKRPKGQPFAVIRFPFSSVSGWADGSGEVVKSAVSISEHAGGASTPDNDKGWNLIANPYMATLSYNGADEGWAADFTVGSLVKTDTDPWDGKYEWTSTTNAYVTMPNEWYTEFPQYRANSAQAVFEPFKNFFIQASANGSVTFDKSKRASAPRHLLAQVEKAQPIYADINLTHGEAFAQAGLTVDENATAGYKFGEDQNIFENRSDLTYLKVYTVADGHYLVGNTMTPAETEELIPVEFYAPNAEGEYIFSLDDNSDIDRLEYVILYDAVLGLNTNLLTNEYMVELDETGLIENRFLIGLRIKEKEDSATGVDNVNSDKERPFKFIYQDKLYILLNGVLYDATGKKVK